MALLDTLNKMAKTIEDKTGDAIEISNYSSVIYVEETGYRNDIKKIGEFYYNFFLNGGQLEPDILPVAQSAKAHLDAAAQAKASIERINRENEAEKEAAKAERAAAREAAKAEKAAEKAAAKAAEAAAKAERATQTKSE